MPTTAEMCERVFTTREWLQYYRNLWTRNVIARTVDTQCDRAVKAKDPEEKVVSDITQTEIPVKERLEERKILVKDGLELLAAIDALLAIPDAEFVEKAWSEEALKVAEDMISNEPAVGSRCEIDGKTGVWMKQEGKMVCAIQSDAPKKEEGAGV